MILQVLRGMRATLKGAVLYRGQDVSPKLTSNRFYVGFRHQDIFGHTNNAKFFELFEMARWESLTAMGFFARCVTGKLYPVVGAASVNYYRQVTAFQVITVQSTFLGISGGGNSLVSVQHLFDSKNRLCATGTFFCSMIDSKSGKTIPIRKAVERMRWSTSEMFLMGDQEISVEEIEKHPELLAALTERRYGLDSKLKLKVPHHDVVSERAIATAVNSTAQLSASLKLQREWLRDAHHGHGSGEPRASVAEGKASKKNHWGGA